jgi:acyl phosphate:glycerol-3-phosphate acyltransferase
MAVLLVDMLKGAAAVILAPFLSASPWAVGAAGVMAVVGHCYPVWLRFMGGMGLATGLGAILVAYWPLGLIAAALLGVIRFAIIKHTPRASIAAALLTIVAAALMNLPMPTFVMVVGVCGFIIARHIVDWNRKYE